MTPVRAKMRRLTRPAKDGIVAILIGKLHCLADMSRGLINLRKKSQIEDLKQNDETH